MLCSLTNDVRRCECKSKRNERNDFMFFLIFCLARNSFCFELIQFVEMEMLDNDVRVGVWMQ